MAAGRDIVHDGFGFVLYGLTAEQGELGRSRG
jgi:hypothetical protein